MQSSKSFKLTGLYQLIIDQLYQQETFDDIKDQLEAIHGAKLVKTVNQGEILLHCIKASIPGQCKYHLKFKVEFRINRKSGKLLRLMSFNLNHNKECIDQEEAAFIKNRWFIGFHYNTMLRLITKKEEEKNPTKNPTQVFQLLCEQLKLEKNFLYEGINDTESKRKLKKKFDNQVADIKRKLKVDLSFIQKMSHGSKPEEKVEQLEPQPKIEQQPESQKIEKKQQQPDLVTKLISELNKKQNVNVNSDLTKKDEPKLPNSPHQQTRSSKPKDEVTKQHIRTKKK